MALLNSNINISLETPNGKLNLGRTFPLSSSADSGSAATLQQGKSSVRVEVDILLDCEMCVDGRYLTGRLHSLASFPLACFPFVSLITFPSKPLQVTPPLFNYPRVHAPVSHSPLSAVGFETASYVTWTPWILSQETRLRKRGRVLTHKVLARKVVFGSNALHDRTLPRERSYDVETGERRSGYRAHFPIMLSTTGPCLVKGTHDVETGGETPDIERTGRCSFISSCPRSHASEDPRFHTHNVDGSSPT
jgi:hypothetical protein